jgi:hypothetical protein
MKIAIVAQNDQHADTLRRSLVPEGSGNALTVLSPGSMTGRRFDRILVTSTLLWAMQRTSVDGHDLRDWYKEQVITRLLPGGEIVNVG